MATVLLDRAIAGISSRRVPRCAARFVMAQRRSREDRSAAVTSVREGTRRRVDIGGASGTAPAGAPESRAAGPGAPDSSRSVARARATCTGGLGGSPGDDCGIPAEAAPAAPYIFADGAMLAATGRRHTSILRSDSAAMLDDDVAGLRHQGARVRACVRVCLRAFGQVGWCEKAAAQRPTPRLTMTRQTPHSLPRWPQKRVYTVVPWAPPQLAPRRSG